MESAVPQGLPRYCMAPRGSDHGHMVRAYQLPTRATRGGLQPLQQRDHCPFALLAEMAEHAYGDARGGTTRPHIGCFLLTCHPLFVVGPKSRFVLRNIEGHCLWI